MLVIASCLFWVCLKYSSLILKGTSFCNRGLPLFLCSKPKWSPLMTLSAVSHRTGRKCKGCLPRCVCISSKPALYNQNNPCLKKPTKIQANKKKPKQGLHFRILSVWNEWQARTITQLFNIIVKPTGKSTYSCKILAYNIRDLSWFNTKIIQSSSTPVLGHFINLHQLLKD